MAASSAVEGRFTGSGAFVIFRGMEEQTYSARRATLDDLPVLRDMWAAERLPVEELDKRVTEFQVAHDAAGTIVAAIGFKRAGEHALIHSEAFTDFGLADEMRELIWARFDVLARNYAVTRLWMNEDLRYWREMGFDPADAETLESLPEELAAEEAEQWFTFVLREELLSSDRAKQTELAFQRAMAAEREKTERQVRSMKLFSTVIAFILFMLIVVAGFYFLKYARNSGYGATPYSTR